MKTDIATLWADTLDSGEYRQAHDAFQELPRDGEPEKLCCLAVATDLAIKDGVEGIRRNQKTGAFEILEEGDWITWEGGDLPPVVQEWLGVDADPDLDGVSAIRRNDGGLARQSFHEIANAIRREAGIPTKAMSL